MDYNDFPILDDGQYKLLLDKFNEQSSFNRKENSFSIYLDLHQCANSIPLLFQQVNSQIAAQLQIAKQNLDAAISNFEATFNPPRQNIEIKESNLFNFLKNLAKIQKKLTNWLKFEQKEYFKQFILNLLENISTILTNILSNLESANLRIFKHI